MASLGLDTENRVSTPGMVVWSPTWEAAQKQEAMQACALKADEILATVHIKTARPDDAAGTQVLQLVDGPEAVKSWFGENNGVLESTIEFNRQGNKDLSGFVLIETSQSSTLSYRPLKLDGTPKKAGRNPSSLATEVEQMTSFTYGELYSTDGFFTYPNDEAKPGTQSRAFLSPLLGFMVAVELSQSEVELTKDKQIRLPCVNQYRIDLIFATPFGVTLKTAQTWSLAPGKKTKPIPYTLGKSSGSSNAYCCALSPQVYSRWLPEVQAMASNIVPPPGFVELTRVNQVLWAIQDFKVASLHDLFSEGSTDIDWVTEVDTDLFVLNKHEFINLLSNYPMSDLTHLDSTDSGSVRPLQFHSLAEWKSAFESMTVPSDHSMHQYIQIVKEEIAAATTAAKKKHHVPVPDPFSVNEDDEAFSEDGKGGSSPLAKEDTHEIMAAKIMKKVKAYDLNSAKGLQQNLRRHVYGATETDIYDLAWFRVLLHRFKKEKFKVHDTDRAVNKSLLACKTKVSEMGDWDADFDIIFADMGVKLPEETTVPEEETDEQEQNKDTEQNKKQDKKRKDKAAAGETAEEKRRRLDVAGEEDERPVGAVFTPAKTYKTITAAVAKAFDRALEEKLDVNSVTEQLERIEDKAGMFGELVGAELAPVFKLLREVKKSVEKDPRADDTNVVLGKISAAAEQVSREVGEALRSKDRIITLQEKAEEYKNRAQALMHMAPSIVRDENSLTNMVLYLVPHVTAGTFKKSELRAMIHSCVAVPRPAREEIYCSYVVDVEVDV